MQKENKIEQKLVYFRSQRLSETTNQLILNPEIDLKHINTLLVDGWQILSITPENIAVCGEPSLTRRGIFLIILQRTI